jgi:indole-3-glycerol phosphate synthase
MLGDLLAGALEDAAARRETRPLAQVEAEALARPAALDALSALAPADRVKIIAEVKRSSPSRGALAEIPDPALLASRYETGGASAISVLTEGRKFRGSLQDLEQVRDTVSIPVLRKDFIGEPYQVLEARASGADLVLVGELGMTALVETHSAEEVSRALDLGAQVVGVNARNLTTFELDRDLFGSLADSIPAGVVRIAESAVKTADDVAHYRRAGADVVLVGEALVTGDPVRTLSEFLDIRA